MAIATNEKYMANMQNNPMEICSIIHKNQTFAIQNGLSEAGQDNDSNQPLKLYSSFSRFPVCIIQDHTSVTANISVDEFPGIWTKSKACIKKEIENCSHPQKQETNINEGQKSPAYTQVLAAGRNMKGKTPAQFISEHEDKNSAIDELRNQYKWLRDNYNKDPESKYAQGNLNQMKAIEEAANLYKAGKLEETASENSIQDTGEYVIFQSGYKPLVRRPMVNNKNFVYEYRITWNFGNDYPVMIRIQNYYAPVETTEAGIMNVNPKQKEKETNYAFKFTTNEWEYCLYMMQANMNILERDYGSSAFKVAQDQFFKNKEEAVKAE